MMESLIAVAQETPALYLNNGVLLSDMKNMAETLFLALRSVTGIILYFNFRSFVSTMLN
jgi:hypothetical protein